MIDLQTVLTYLTLISVPVGVAYHIMTLNNTRKNQRLQLETRQAALLMDLMNNFRSAEFRKQWHTLWHIKWKDEKDFQEQYYGQDIEVMSAYTSVMTYFESVGILVKSGLIDIEKVYSMLGGAIKMIWDRYGVLMISDRDYFQEYNLQGKERWDNFEYLYSEITRYDQQKTAT